MSCVLDGTPDSNCRTCPPSRASRRNSVGSGCTAQGGQSGTERSIGGQIKCQEPISGTVPGTFSTCTWQPTTLVHPADGAPGLKKADMLIPLGVAFRTPNREVSMSTSLLYHAFGIRGYQYTRTQYQGGRIIFTIHQGPESCCCSSCGSARVIRRGQVVRQFRSLPIGGRATFVVLPIPRVECQTCGSVARWRSASPTHGGATPPALNATPWNWGDA